MNNVSQAAVMLTRLRGCLSLLRLPPPASVLPPLTVEQRRGGHGRRILHPAALSKRCGTAHTSNSHPTASADNLAHNPLHAPFTCCDVYDDVRCDPSDGAGAGVTYDTHEVRGPRSRRWESSARRACGEGLARESERASVVPRLTVG